MNATKITAFAATAAVAVSALAPAVGMAKATGPGKYTVTKQAYVYKQPTKIVDGTVFKGNTIKVEKLSQERQVRLRHGLRPRQPPRLGRRQRPAGQEVGPSG